MSIELLELANRAESCPVVRAALCDELQAKGMPEAEAEATALAGDLAPLREALAKANGRRSARTIHFDDVIACIRRAATEGVAVASGGRVANAYKYPAIRTICVAVRRTDGTVRVVVGTADAKKGAGNFGMLGLRSNSKPEQFTAWADAGR